MCQFRLAKIAHSVKKVNDWFSMTQCGMLQGMNSIRVIQIVPTETIDLPEGLVSVDDSARYLSVARETVRRFIAQGTLKAERHENTPGRHGWRWMLSTDELMRVKAEREASKAS